jgi:Putative Ig domain
MTGPPILGSMMRLRLGWSGLLGSLTLLCSAEVAAQAAKPVVPPPTMPAPAAPAPVGAPRAVAVVPTTTPTPVPLAKPMAGAAPTPALPTAATPAVPPAPVAAPAPPPDIASTASPRFVKLLPSRYDKDEITIAVDQELRLAVVVEHPDGRALQMQALGLPVRATFDPELRAVTWRPTEAEVGSYQVRFVVSDGLRETSRTILISVTENHAPILGSLWFEVPAGQPGTWFIDGKDPEFSPVTFSVEGLPKGATFDESSGRITFTPDASQVGEYPIVVHASDGQKATSQRGTIAVRATERPPAPGDEWTSFLLPGVGYSIYAPRDNAKTIFHGLNLEVVIAAWIHRNDNRGPSLGRVYVNAELLNATGINVPLMFAYSTGLSLSFERNPQRTWLIPYYGIEVGGIVHNQIGSYFQTTPYAGVHVFSNPNVFLGTRLGYRLVPSRVDDLAGLHFGVVADFSIW